MRLAAGFFAALVALAQNQPSHPSAEPGKASIEGAVVDSLSHSPIRKAAVTLSGRTFSRAVTGADGHFAFRQLPAGTYVLQAQAEKYPANSQFSFDISNQASVSIAGDEDKTGVELSLTPGASVRGRIVDEDGSPMPQCAVTPTRLRNTENGKSFVDFNTTQTDDKGEYRIENLPAGKYYMVSRCFLSIPLPHAFVRRNAQAMVPMLTYPPLFYPGSADPSGATRVTLAAATELAGIDFQVVPATGVPVRGRVQPVPANTNLQVMLRPKDPLVRRWQQQGARLDSRTGEFQIPSVRPGSYELVAMTRGNSNYTASTSVEVGGTPPDPIELHLVPAAQITGTIAFDGETNVSLKNLQIFVMTTDEQPVAPMPRVEVQEDGTFSLSVPPGHYRLRVNGAAGYIKSMTAGDQEVSPGSLEIGAAPVSLKIVFGTKNAQVDATVQSLPANGGPVYGALWSPDLDFQQNVQAMPPAPARFNFSVPPGKYYICATAATQPVMSDRAFRNALASHCSTIEVTEGGHSSVQIPFLPIEDLKRVAESLDADGSAAF